MSAIDLVMALLRINLILTPLAALILLARPWLRRSQGAEAAIGLWAMIPLAALGAVMPLDPATGPVGPAEGWAAAARVWLADAERADIFAAAWAAGVVVSVAVAAVRLARFRAAERRGMAGPAAAGFIAPRLVSPTDFADRFTPQEWRLVRAHERAHMDRLDGRAATLAAVGQWLCWCNPVAHLALAAYRLDQELVCDAAVIRRHPGERRRYGEMLLQSQSSGAGATVCVSPWAQGSLKVRIEMLARSGRPAARAELAVQALLIGWIVAFAIGWAVQAPTRMSPEPTAFHHASPAR